ncbi:MAG: TonB-dependent receptor [Pedobacter sp.]|nr:MAG: TonB-dependent receptor [Pedobacter sp.]
MKTIYLKIMLAFACIICVSTYANKLHAQVSVTYTLQGTLKSATSDNFDDVSVYLLKASDKALVKMEQANAKGEFKFENVGPGKYLIMSQSFRFSPYQSEPLEVNKDLHLGDILLQGQTQQLKAVTINAEKPLIQQSFDKTTVNVSNSIAAVGSNALEVLGKAPGVNVDPNENLAMRGKQGVMVMVDGKPLNLGGTDLSNYLKSLQATQIDKIDLITNPSAKFDAAGNAGIIDIRLKKSNLIGTNGNLTLTAGMGRYEKFTPNVSLNHKRPKANYFSSYAFNRNRGFNDLEIIRDFYTPEKNYFGSNVYDNYFKNRAHTHNVRLGADFNLTPHQILGFSANGIYTDILASSNSLANTFDAQHLKNGAFLTKGQTTPERRNSSINLNYRAKLDTLGRELAIDADYASFNMAEIQNYKTLYMDQNGNPVSNPYLLMGDLNGALDIKSVKADYSTPLKAWNAKLEMGWKSSWVKTDNEVNFFDKSGSTAVLDTGKSNHFIYKENINAIYVNGNKAWNKFQLQMGLRLENTRANGLQVIKNETFERDYYQLFPSAFLGYTFNDSHMIGLSASRRINRPSYRQLNPFKSFLDPLTYATGNPYLLPEISEVYEFSYTLQQKYLFKLGYTHTADNILSILGPDVEPRSVVQIPRNLANYHYYNASLSFPFKIGKWYSSNQDITTYYGKYQGDIGSNNLNLSRVSYQINSVNSIKLTATTSAEVSANYQSKGYYGPLDFNGVFVLNMGIQKQIMNRQASLRLNFNDVFFSNRTDAKTALNGYNEFFLQKRETQVMNLSFSYRFGKSNGNNTRRQGAAEEEKRRAN